jgi:hypothetical protein
MNKKTHWTARGYGAWVAKQEMITEFWQENVYDKVHLKDRGELQY